MPVLHGLQTSVGSNIRLDPSLRESIAPVVFPRLERCPESVDGHQERPGHGIFLILATTAEELVPGVQSILRAGAVGSHQAPTGGSGDHRRCDTSLAAPPRAA